MRITVVFQQSDVNCSWTFSSVFGKMRGVHRSSSEKSGGFKNCAAIIKEKGWRRRKKKYSNICPQIAIASCEKFWISEKILKFVLATLSRMQKIQRMLSYYGSKYGSGGSMQKYKNHSKCSITVRLPLQTLVVRALTDCLALPRERLQRQESVWSQHEAWLWNLKPTLVMATLMKVKAPTSSSITASSSAVSALQGLTSLPNYTEYTTEKKPRQTVFVGCRTCQRLTISSSTRLRLSDMALLKIWRTHLTNFLRKGSVVDRRKHLDCKIVLFPSILIV